MRTLFATFFFFGTLALTACGGSSASDQEDLAATEAPASTDEAELRAKKCGGFAGLTCRAGYDCIITAHHPDAMGTCKKHRAPTCATMTCPAGQSCMVMDGAPMCM